MKSGIKVPGSEIKRLRRLAGLSQAELAELVGGVSQSKISRCEKDDFSDWSERSLNLLYQVLRIDPKTDLVEKIWGICPNFTCCAAYWEMTEGILRVLPYAQKLPENNARFCVHCQTPLISACPGCKALITPGQSGCGVCGKIYVTEPSEISDDKVEHHNAKRQKVLDLRAYFEHNS